MEPSGARPRKEDMRQCGPSFGPRVQVASSRDVFALLRPRLAGKPCAELWRLELLGRGLLELRLISVGRIDRLIPSAPEVFADVPPGRAVLLAHNHPSQDETPGDCDFIAAYLLDLGAQALGIELRDFLILSDAAFFSFRERGEL